MNKNIDLIRKRLLEVKSLQAVSDATKTKKNPAGISYRHLLRIRDGTSNNLMASTETMLLAAMYKVQAK